VALKKTGFFDATDYLVLHNFVCLQKEILKTTRTGRSVSRSEMVRPEMIDQHPESVY